MATLAAWEKRLTPYFNTQLHILAEIPLTESDLDEILDLVRDEINTLGLPKTTERLEKFYPHTFLTMLAHFAAHNDQQGYWNTLGARLDTEYLFNYQWHRKFVAACRDLGLFTFTRQDMNNYYVATIRFHGGIPTYSLPDFFEQMVEPAVTRSEYREVPPKQLLPHLIRSVYFVDKPVLDFLENSGEMGRVWFEECVQLFRHAKDNYGEVLPKAKVPSIPLYIYQFFEKYNEGLDDSRYHWRRPFLQVTPFEDDSAVVLVLPQQAVPIDFYTQGLVWKITWPGLVQPIVRACQMKRLRQDIVTEEDYYTVSGTPETITVSIQSAGKGQEEEYRRWTLPLMPADPLPKFLAFREDQRHIPNPQTLPEKPLYLLMPTNYQLEVDGGGVMTGSFPGFIGEWEDWKIEAWDLTHTLAISLLADGVVIGESIPVAREMAQPELVGGHQFDYQENPDEPLYTSGVPEVQVPIQRGLDKFRALKDWTVHVASVWEALPEVDKTISLQSMHSQVEIRGDVALFPLREVLGEQPAGIYDIKISGPKGQGSEHRVRLWPKFLVRDLSFEFPSPEEAHQDEQFEVRLQEGATLINQAGAEEVEIVKVDGAYLINAPPQVYRVRLDLVTKTKEEKLVRIPVSVPLPRLRWALAEEKTPGSLSFGQEALHISISRFDQYQSSALHFEMHGLDKMANQLKLQLVEVGEGVHVLAESELSRLGFIRDRLRAPLRLFSTTVQASNTLMQFDLVYQKDWQSEPIRYPVLTLSPKLAIQSVALQPEGEVSWRLSWTEEKPLKHRRVMIQSTWQPWQPPMEFSIPDEAKGELLINNVSLPPSQYAIYFYVMNPWSDPLTKPPEGIEPHLVALRSPEARLLELDYDGEDHDRQFQNAIERACIYDSLGENEKRDESVSEAAKHLRYVENVKTLIGSIKWLQGKEIAPTYKSFFSKNLFHPDIVETMLGKYRPTDPALFEYLHMTAEVKSIHLNSARRLLESVDDPIVIAACLNELIRKKDKTLVSRIVSMVEEERLSIDDGVTYLLKLSDDRMMVINEFEQFEWSPHTEQLIKGFLHEVFDEISDNDKSSEAMKSAMFRAAHFELSQERMHQYLAYLLRNEWNKDDVYELIIDRHLAGILGHKFLFSLMEIHPDESLRVLKDYVESFPEYEPLIQYLEEAFPSASGLLTPGLSLNTPFGIARIEKIIHPDGSTLETAKYSDERFILVMVEGEGLDQIRVRVDFEEMELIFEGVESVWRCECCQSFIHPDQNRLLAHHKQAHPGQNHIIQKVKATRFFSRDDIQYLAD